MPFGSQRSTVETLQNLSGLVHDVFVGSVVNNVRRTSATSEVFQDASPGTDYKLVGEAMVFATELRFKTGAMATDGSIPDHVGLDAVQGRVTPVRRYQRVAMDNFVEARATGEGAFDDFRDRLFDHLWDAWESMEARHSVGASSGLVCVVDARLANNQIRVRDGYGNAGTNPLTNLSENSIIGWYDVSEGRVGGAAKITNTGIDYVDNEITVDSAATWETAVGAQIAAGDLIYFATTHDTTRDYFTLERNLAPNGVGTLLDPNATFTAVHDIDEGDYPRWKPYRTDSVTCDHMEFKEHWLQLGQKRGFPVTPATDVVITFPSVVAQVARSLIGFQQQSALGGELEGGYSGIAINGIRFLEDPFFYHNHAITVARDHLFRIPLGGDADFFAEDGSMFQRIADFDGKEAFVVDYLQNMTNHRGAHGVLANIVTDLNDELFTNVPNY